jgi:hypothetical protein
VTQDKQGTRFEILETDPRFHPVFSALCADLLDSLVSTSDAPVSPTNLWVARINRWRNCFALAPEGLSKAAQTGMFGELYVLRLLLEYGIPSDKAVAGWRGPYQAHQDFQIDGWAIEVKTSRQAQPADIRISSELQLDCPGPLALVHVAVDVRHDGPGQSLVGVIGELRERLHSNEMAFPAFEEALIEGGYLDVHAARYTDKFSVRFMDTFVVREGFPRIVEADLPSGIGNVSYDLALAACVSHGVSLLEFMDLMAVGGH